MRILNLNGDYVLDHRLGDIIRNARNEKGLTIAQLSAKIGCSPTYITRIELGQRTTTNVLLLNNISKSLNIPLYELIDAVLPETEQQGFTLKKLFSFLSEDEASTISNIVKIISSANLSSTQLLTIVYMVEAYVNAQKKLNK